MSDPLPADLMALVESQTRLQDLLSCPIIAIVSLRYFESQDWEWNYFSAGCESLFGFTAEEFMADKCLWLSRLSQEDVEGVITPLLTAITAECCQAPHEYRFRHKDGTLRWMLGNLCSRRDEVANCWIVTILAADISDRKQIEADRQQMERALRQREAELQALLDHAPDVIMRLDRQFRLLYINPRAECYTGLPVAAMLGHRIDEIGQSAETVATWQEAIQRALETGEEQACEYAYGSPSGITYHSSRIVPELDAEGKILSFLAISRDISDRHRLELTLHQQAEREHLLRTITAHIRQSLNISTILATTVNEVHHTLEADRTLIFRLHRDGSGQVIQEVVRPEYPITDQMLWLDEDFPAACITYYRQGKPRIVPDVALDDWGACLVPFMAEAQVKSKLVAPIVNVSENSESSLWGLLIVHACADYCHWTLTEAQFLQQIADQLAIAIQQADLYEQLQRANQQLQHLATHDALTQIANRRALNDFLEQEWQRSARDQTPLTLILADIDYFKQYNDTYGHPAGDRCLVQVAQVLSRSIRRPADFIARYGGEEFALVLPNTPVEGAIQRVQALQHDLRQDNLPHAGSALPTQQITLSFGLTWEVAQPTGTYQGLLSRADRALYQAKATGRNRWEICPPPLERLAHQHN